MPVFLTVAKEMGGATNDILSGGVGGYFLGVVSAGKFNDPVDLYVTHDGAESIIDLSVYIAPFSQFYGGNVNAGNNYLQLALWGEDGFGMQLSQDALQADDFVDQIDGNNGFNFATKIPVRETAMVYNNASVETLATSPESGVIGPAGDAVLGDNAHIKSRVGTPAPPQYIGGAIQFDFVFFYQFSS